MSKIKVTWQVYDGYVGGSRPQSFEVDPAEFAGLSETEAYDLLNACLRDDFEQKVSASIDDEEEVMTLIMSEAAKTSDGH